MKIEQEAELHNWRILDFGEHKQLVGAIYNDKTFRFSNGEMIRTTFIRDMNEEEGWAITRNTKYWLK